MKVIEFLGMPRAGKTTAIEVAENYLKKEGERVRTIYEGARVCPLDKSSRFSYHSWSFHNTINRILEARINHYDFILVDRGILDHMAFLKAVKNECPGKNIESMLNYYVNFLDIQNLEIFFSIDPKESISRESKNKPFVGRVFNLPFLKKLFDSYSEVLQYAEAKGREIIQIEGDSPLQENLQKILWLLKRYSMKNERKN